MIAVAVSAVSGGTPQAATVIIGLMVTSLAAAAFAVVCFALGTLIARTVPALLTVVGVLLAPALVTGMLAPVLPAALGSIVTSVAAATPAPLLFQALSFAAALANDPASLWVGLGGLAVWATVATLAAYARFARRDA